MNVFLSTSHCLRANGSTSPHSLALGCRLSLHAVTHATRHTARYSSQLAAADIVSHRPLGRVPLVRAFGFRELGIRDPIVAALGKAFPDVQRPTLSQAEFIPAILNGQDVVLHDETGTGKSFGTVLALLSKSRAKPISPAGMQPDGPCITSLVVVPHRDLGFQMLHWIASILQHSGQRPPSLESIAQLVARGDSTSTQQAHQLLTTPPHILIGTPQALWEIYQEDRRALQVENLATLVVDEVDYLLDVPPPYVRKRREGAAWKNFRKHPSSTRLLLEEILPMRRPGAMRLSEADEEDSDDEYSRGPKQRGTSRRLMATPPLQVVMSSATVHSNLTDHLWDARWLKDGCMMISGKQLAKTNAHMIYDDGQNKSEVVHHAFVVSLDGKLSNVEFAVRPDQKEQTKDKKDRRPEYPGKSEHTKSVPPQLSTSPQMMEAVATFFALDVPQLALLVLPPNSAVQKAVSELCDLGVDARMLDLRSGDVAQLGRLSGQTGAESGATLLVATPASTRGVDLPQLTHVFCVGTPDLTSADSFKHISGRVDRFGRGGKIITFITEREQEQKEGMVRTTKNPAGLLRMFYRKLRIEPVWFDLGAVEMALNEQQ
ncbi:hypothetical protein M0805_000364 [Coniferiporia weirii]|nr:hypothetical protein M0805_000364 [Coniferiporia weirii]